LNTALSVAITGYNSVAITANQGSTITAGAITFEASDDNTNWYGITAVRANSRIMETAYGLTASTLQAWEVDVRGFTNFRVRLSTAITGTGSVTLGLSPQAFAGNPAVAISGLNGASQQNFSSDNSGNFPSSITVGSDADNLFAAGSRAAGNSPVTAAVALHGFDGTNPPRLRTCAVFKTASATASGNTALWTPTSGKKFRLLRYIVEVTQNAAQSSAGVLTIAMQDGTSDIAQTHSVFVPGTAGTTFGSGFTTHWVDVSNGILSSTANNVLNVNLSAALSAGVVRVTACGTEE
jgi:hypothetical protein